MNAVPQLGDLQLAILRALWSRGEATVAEVHGALAARDLALTTIATMLMKMEQRGLVSHRAEGRRFIYQPLLSEGEVRRSALGDLKARLFGGNTAELVNHLLTEHEVSGDELAQLKQMIQQQADKEKKEGR